MKKLFLFPILIISLFVKAQTVGHKERVITNVNDIGWVIVDHYKPQEDSVKNNCWAGCVFIRFTINSKRQFTNIGYTASTPFFIKDALMNAFLAINKKSSWINQMHKTDNSTYILPLIIYNRDGCGFMSGWEDASYKPDEKTKEMYAMRQYSYNQSINSIFNILNFSDLKLNSINCILLSPLQTGYVMY
ncbi:MAG: hypothetical protein ABIN91_22505 [Mucilaginibacter sp.]|uniref:hypothetical protein n=1 Tax=Mucilaginibacter sp. TaxID=1882438 RepID=UPI003267AE55